MIVRILTVHVKPGQANQFNSLMREELATLRAQPGLVYAKLARRFEPDGSEEVVLFEEWRGPQDVYGWAGADLSKPRLRAGSEELLTDVRVVHLEGLDVADEPISPG